MKKTIGLFGGTFDPIHFGHLNLAIELKEKCHLSEVWFIPASQPPLRAQMQSCTPQDRFKMTERAIEGIPGFSLCDLEMKRSGTSYTADTIKEIFEKHPGEDFALLLGEDSALSFPRWKDPLTIVNTLPLLVGCRHGIEMRKKIKNPLFPKEIRAAIQKGIIETRLMDIEGVEVRKRLKERLYCGHLLPSKVLDYIYENQLYFNS